VGGHQLLRLGTPHLCQHEARDLLPVVVPRHGSCGRMTRDCTLKDPLGIEAVCQPGLLLGCPDEDVLGKFNIYVSNFNCFVL
jgi:hypothetical protein